MKLRFQKLESTRRHERAALALICLATLGVRPAAAVGHWTRLRSRVVNTASGVPRS